mgnify:FL=1
MTHLKVETHDLKDIQLKLIMMNKHTGNGFRSLLVTFAICTMSWFSFSALAAPVHLTGKVQDANGEPLIGASVLEKGTSNGTITDYDGVFTLVVEEDVE